MSVLVSTVNAAMNDRVELWRSATSQSFVPLDFQTPDAAIFRGEITGTSLGHLLVAKVSATAHHVQRTARHIARSDADSFYKLSIPIRGYVLISQDGREAPLVPGDIAMYDTNRPYSVMFEDACQMLVVMFPQREFHLSSKAMSSLTALRISGRRGIGGVVSPMLLGLAGRTEEVTNGLSTRLADNVIDLIGTLFADQAAELGHRPSDPRRILMIQIRSFIETNLDDPDLSPETIAAGCHISVGYLHKLFRSEETSVSRLVRDRRLEQCRRELLDPNRAGMAVRNIGAHWGFFDAAYFSRAFKDAYGLAPREYRLARDVSGDVEVTASLS